MARWHDGTMARFDLYTRTCYHKYRLYTIRAIINKWAPPTSPPCHLEFCPPSYIVNHGSIFHWLGRFFFMCQIYTIENILHNLLSINIAIRILYVKNCLMHVF